MNAGELGYSDRTGFHGEYRCKIDRFVKACRDSFGVGVRGCGSESYELKVFTRGGVCPVVSKVRTTTVKFSAFGLNLKFMQKYRFVMGRWDDTGFPQSVVMRRVDSYHTCSTSFSKLKVGFLSSNFKYINKLKDT